MPKRKLHSDVARFQLQRQSVCEFFADQVQWNKVKPFLDGTNGVSLRLLDHFVTSYARTHACEYYVDSTKSMFNVYHGMQTALHGLNKKRLDPFRRSQVDIEIHGYKTNVAQLTFFRWALINGVLDYVMKHKEAINADRKECLHKKATQNVREIVIELPKEVLEQEEDEHDVKRIIETLEECVQRPKKKRKRIFASKMDVKVQVSDKPIITFNRIKSSNELFNNK